MTDPTPVGNPRWAVLLWFPALLLVIFVGLVALGLSGSSTGMFWQVFGSGDDPSLLAGTPQGVRSDEWMTQGSWIVSQYSQGFPSVNQVFPGGMDAAGLFDLPAWSWVSIFRPQTIGFLLFGLDHGIAWRWWLPGLAMVAACYCMLINLMPRRPLSSAVISVAFFFAPLLQWWILPAALWPGALCFLAIAAVVYSLREHRRWPRVVWAAVTGYVGLCAAITLYPPYLVPAMLVCVLVCAGDYLTAAGIGGRGPAGESANHPQRLGALGAARRLLPLLIAAGVAAACMLLWAVQHAQTLQSITDMVYPGDRRQPTGAIGYDGLVQIFAAPFADGLQVDEAYSGLLGPNASEAATPVLIGLFLLIPLGWCIVRDWRHDRRWHPMMLGCIAAGVILFAFLLIPGWDALAHLLFLDRTVVNRCRLGLGLLSIVAIGLLIGRLDERDVRVSWSASLITTAVAAVSVIVVWVALREVSDPALVASSYHKVVAVLFVLSVLLYTRNRAFPASVAFLIVSLLVGAGVNPLYRGMFNLADTAMGRAVERINDQKPGAWLGMGSFQLGAVLVETGVEAFNGVQTYPSEEMWREVDPTGRYAQQWNRYGSIRWEFGTGEPTLRNPQDDVIVGTFDSCSAFARQHVTYVMADADVDQPCLRPLDKVSQGALTFSIYEVTR